MRDQPALGSNLGSLAFPAFIACFLALVAIIAVADPGDAPARTDLARTRSLGPLLDAAGDEPSTGRAAAPGRGDNAGPRGGAAVR